MVTSLYFCFLKVIKVCSFTYRLHDQRRRDLIRYLMLVTGQSSDDEDELVYWFKNPGSHILCTGWGMLILETIVRIFYVQDGGC